MNLEKTRELIGDIIRSDGETSIDPDSAVSLAKSLNATLDVLDKIKREFGTTDGLMTTDGSKLYAHARTAEDAKRSIDLAGGDFVAGKENRTSD